MDKYEAVLDAMDEQFRVIQEEYQESLDAKEVTARLATAIKSMVEHGRSVLDYLAHDITEKSGNPKDLTYYPYASDEHEFPSRMDRDMPGVAATRPDVANVIRKYQAYRLPWLKYLNALAKENKHRDLTPQMKKQRVQREIRRSGSKRAAISWDPETSPLGEGVVINNEIFDPTTQRLIPGMSEQFVTDIPYQDWQFTDLGVSALRILGQIRSSLRPAVREIRDVAGV